MIVNSLVMNTSWGLFRKSLFSILSNGWPAAFVSKGTSIDSFIQNVFSYKTFLRRRYLDTVSDSEDLEDSDEDSLYGQYHLLKLAFQSVVWKTPTNEEYPCILEKGEFTVN